MNGDNKTEVIPIFHVTLILSHMHIQLSPDINSMLDMVHKVSRNLIVVIQSVPRLSLQLTDRQARELQDAGLPQPKPLPSLYEVISSDEEAVLRTMMQVTVQDGFQKLEILQNLPKRLSSRVCTSLNVLT